MDTLAHITAGYFLTDFLIRLENDPKINQNRKQWLSWGIFCSQLPDFDEMIPFAFSRSKRYEILHEGSNHHRFLMHLPLFYISIITTVLSYNFSKPNAQIKFALKVFSAHITAHLIMDSLGLGQGLRWLYPFSRKQYGIGLTHKVGPEDWKEFFSSKRVIYEIIIYFLAVLEIFTKKQKNHKSVNNA